MSDLPQYAYVILRGSGADTGHPVTMFDGRTTRLVTFSSEDSARSSKYFSPADKVREEYIGDWSSLMHEGAKGDRSWA